MKTKHLIYFCNFIAFFAALYAATEFFKMFTLGYELGKDAKNETYDLLYYVAARGSIAWGVILICLMLFLLVNNYRKGWVFVKENEQLFLIFGIAISIFGLLSNIIIWTSPTTLSNVASNLLLLIGLCLVFISFTFKIGIKMQEEQELTI